MGFRPYQSHHIASSMAPKRSKENSVNSNGGSSFDVLSGDGKGGIGPRTT